MEISRIIPQNHRQPHLEEILPTYLCVDFRLVHLDALAGLFVQVLRLCQKAGLVSLGTVALVAAGFRDAVGTKVKANASKHKAMSHERMLKTEAQLEAEIAALLRKAELIDAQEDAYYGKGKRGDELPVARSASAQR